MSNLLSLDRIDRRILLALDCNARASFAEVANELKLPQETVRYRYTRLMDNGIITAFYPVIATGFLGLSVHKVMFKLQKADEDQIEAVGKFVSKYPHVNWVARFDGCFDLGCTLVVRHVGEVSTFVDAVRKRFHAFVRGSAYAVNLHAEFFPRDYLVRASRTARTAASYLCSEPGSGKLTVDHTDRRILQKVATDTRVTSTAIAREIGVSVETVNRRLARLEKDRVITGYRLVLNHERVGFVSYYLLLYLNYVSSDRREELLKHLRSHPSVVYLIKMLGAWDYDVSIELPDVAAYRMFLIDLMKHYSDVIRDVETLVTWRILKFSILSAEE